MINFGQKIDNFWAWGVFELKHRTSKINQSMVILVGQNEETASI